jgi:UDP-N-acetylmuramate dehydrogenase
MNSWRIKAGEALQGVKITPDFFMSQLTSFKIGGPIDLLAEPTNREELERVIQFCMREHLPWLVIGSGSNLLVRDKGIRGVGIKLSGLFTRWEANGTEVTAGAGMSLTDLAKVTAALGLSGLEFACGIPGSVGGAVFMNAGAYDGEISQVLKSVQAYDPETGFAWYNKADLNLGYRFSRFQIEPKVVVEVVFQLKRADQDIITARIADLTLMRQSKQPLDLPSAGSVFRRPEGYYVGPLIEGAGLKGFSIGGAQVSPKHAGFIVNTGNATARDVLDVIAHIQRVIAECNGVELKTEIRVIGEE